jgi:uncharacterized protein (DUF1015 family)
MAIVRPFKGVRYNPEKVLLKHVIAPPYDVIGTALRDTLVQRSQCNAVNIDLPEGEDRYQKAAQLYQSWRADDILLKDQKPGFYIYEQEYEYQGRSYIRSGFVGMMKLEPLGEGTVYPHEKTLSGPKQDRLDLMRATKANFSQIFGLFLDPDNRMTTIYHKFDQGMPAGSAVDDDGTKHTIWPVTDEKVIQDIQAMMKDKAVYIADGHHRYETALLYRDEMRKQNEDIEGELQPYDYVMMMFVNFYDQGLMIFPTHRVLDLPTGYDEAAYLKQISADFMLQKLDDSVDAVDTFLAAHTEPGTMAMVVSGGTYGLLLHQEQLDSCHPVYRNIDTFLLENNILKKHLHIPEEQLLAKRGIAFVQTEKAVRERVAKGGIGFILKSTSMEAVRQVSESGLVMPQKSTYFYPKLATGLLFNDL